MKAACPRLFEAEALRDGRLTGAEVARFRTHLGLCAVCAREARTLEVLGAALRSASEAGARAEVDELHVRRERTRLLARFDESLVPAPRRGSPKRLLVPAAMFAVLTALALGFAWWRPAVPRVPAVVSEHEAVRVRADSTAKWSRRADARLETIVLESGTLSIRVDHASSARRLLVVLPDGELEDIGTTFSVSVDRGRTARVSVQEGSVVLRLREKPPLALAAGEAWLPEPVPVVSPPASNAAPPPPSAPARASAARSALSVPAVAASASGPDPAADFRFALASFNRGDAAHAAALFAAFLVRHPSDARAEDAAYLRFLALRRAGDSSAAKAAAEDYLRRHPTGFRRAEVIESTREP